MNFHIMIDRCLCKKVSREATFLFLLIVSSLGSMAAVQNPDFAYPQTVCDNAEVKLKESLDKRFYAEALQYAVQIEISKDLISSDDYAFVIGLYDDLANKMPSPYKELAILLKARKYVSLYNANRWVYNNRTLPVSYSSADVKEWSRDIFALKVRELVDSAFVETSVAKKTALSVVSAVLKDWEEAEKAGMTVYDFMTIKSVDMLKTFVNAGSARIIPFSNVGVSVNGVRNLNISQKIMDLLDSDIEWHESKDETRLAAIFDYIKYRNLTGEESKSFLRVCIDKYHTTPYCARFILGEADAYDAVDEEYIESSLSGKEQELTKYNNNIKRKYRLIEDYLKKFPDCENSDVLRAGLQQLCDKNVSVSISNRVYPGKEGRATVKSSNVFDFNLLLVKVPESYVNKGIKADEVRKYGNVVERIPVSFKGSAPETFEKEIIFSPLKSGIYVFVPSSTSELSGIMKGVQQKMSFATFNVSSLQYFISNEKSKGNNSRIYITDGWNQKPVKGAKITLTTYRNKSKLNLITNGEGYAEFPSGSYEMTVRYGSDRLDNGIWAGNYYGSQNREHISGRVLTDLSIYHPGDSLGFVGIAFRSKDREMSPLSDKKIYVYLMDANWQKVDSLELKTDKFGRVTGKLFVPTSGLLGQYSVNMCGSEDGNTYGSAMVEVADYKSPTFYIAMDGSENTYKIGDKISLKGKVMTYSGMPVGNAKVAFDVSYQTLPWLDSGVNANFGGEAETAEDGTFSIDLDTDGLRDTQFAFGCYRMNITAVNPAGETQSASPVYFSIGSAYTISSDIPSRVLASGVQTFGVKVNDIVGTPKEKKVYYKVENTRDNSILRQGEFLSPVFSLDTDSLASGRYNITFSLNEKFLNNVNERNYVSEVTVYRNTDKCPPYQTSLWVPENQIIVPEGARDVKVKFGSSYADSWIFVQIADCDKVLDRRWIKVNGVNDVLTVQSPSDNNRISLVLTGVHDYNLKMETINIIPQIQTEKIEIKTVSFRDALTPGMKETWKFNFTLKDNALAGIPVSAVMSNKALNALAPFNWSFDPASGLMYESKGNLRPSYLNKGGSWNMQISRAKSPAFRAIEYPTWNFYGYGNDYGTGSFVKNLRVRGSSMTGGAVYASVEQKSAVMMSAAKEQAVPGEGGDGLMNKIESADESDMIENNGSIEQEVVLREVECPLAFFMPMLVTDAEGSALIDFEVPQFNGTWQFQIMGYTPELKGMVKSMSAVASKPVMAQMNAPRFLRTGDVGSVGAMLYNNSKDTILMNGRIEIFNPLDGKIFDTLNSKDMSVKPAGSTEISLDFEIPSDINYIGIRVYAYGGNFTDGEQTVVPVYPSSTPVLESQPFYISPGQKEFSMSVKGGNKNAGLTLVYCDNPIWEVVKALPSLIENESANVLAQVYSFYGNAVASGLIRKYPELKEGIKLFSDPANSGDSALVSNLEKNQGIKNILLNNTPWVQSAVAESLRMQSLIKYTDQDKCKAEIDAQVKKIMSLQNADGGWSWCDGMKSSDFVTARVLLHLGMLENMGYLPTELGSAAENGVKYADAQWVKDYKEYRGGKYPYLSMMNYLYVRANFSDVPKSAAFSEMETKTLAAIKNQWKSMDIYGKATAAIVLHRYGYDMESRSILESLRQYAKVSKESGMWYDNLSSSRSGWNKLITTAQVLEAYNEILPDSESVDLLRQWLLVSKQTEDWGRNRYMAEVINVLLTTGTKWTIPSSPAEILLGGEKIAVPKVAKLTGSLSVSLDNKKGGTLEIRRTGAGPAWGGVVSQFVEPIKDVKADKCSELSIDKQIYVINNDANGTQASVSDLKVGDRVRITLTIKCKKDIEYLAVTDSRSACLEPAEQTSGYGISEGVWMYKEIRNDATNLFIPFLGKGTHVISYDCFVDREGTYALGMASAQSQYAPEIAAHSAGSVITVR